MNLVLKKFFSEFTKIKEIVDSLALLQNKGIADLVQEGGRIEKKAKEFNTEAKKIIKEAKKIIKEVQTGRRLDRINEEDETGSSPSECVFAAAAAEAVAATVPPGP